MKNVSRQVHCMWFIYNQSKQSGITKKQSVKMVKAKDIRIMLPAHIYVEKLIYIYNKIKKNFNQEQSDNCFHNKPPGFKSNNYEN